MLARKVLISANFDVSVTKVMSVDECRWASISPIDVAGPSRAIPGPGSGTHGSSSPYLRHSFETLGGLLKVLGVLNVPGWTSAMRQHIQQIPASVVADALGYHYVTTTKIAAEAATWSRYVTAPDSSHPSAEILRQLATVE